MLLKTGFVLSGPRETEATEVVREGSRTSVPAAGADASAGEAQCSREEKVGMKKLR